MSIANRQWTVFGGKKTWMHIQVPTPVLAGAVQAKLLRVFSSLRP
jgi:hypothetical protein